MDISIWGNTPKELLKYIFQYLNPCVLNSILIKYMDGPTLNTNIIIFDNEMDWTLSAFVKRKYYLLCKEYIKYNYKYIDSQEIMDTFELYNIPMKLIKYIFILDDSINFIPWC